MTARIEDVNADAASTGLAGVGAALEQIAHGKDPILAMAPVFASHDDNYLHMDATDPLVAKFYVRLALRGGHGHVRVFDEGPRSAFALPIGHGMNGDWAKGRHAWYDIELSEVVLRPARPDADRVGAQGLRREHARARSFGAYASRARATRADRRARPTARTSSVSGELKNYWDRPYDGAWNLALDLQEPRPDPAHLHQVQARRRRTSVADHDDRPVHRAAQGRRSISTVSTTTCRCRPPRSRCT